MLEDFLKYTLGEEIWPIGVIFLGIFLFFGLLFLIVKIMNTNRYWRE